MSLDTLDNPLPPPCVIWWHFSAPTPQVSHFIWMATLTVFIFNGFYATTKMKTIQKTKLYGIHFCHPKTLLIVELFFQYFRITLLNLSEHCGRGGAIVDDFLEIGGSAMIFLTRSLLDSRRIFCLDIVDDSVFYPLLQLLAHFIILWIHFLCFWHTFSKFLSI